MCVEYAIAKQPNKIDSTVTSFLTKYVHLV